MLATTQLTVPIVPRGDQEEIAISLTEIMVAETRGDEIAAVTPTKAPELLATFNAAYRDLTQMISTLTLEHVRAKDAVEKIQGIIILERAPGIIEAKGLSNSADIRRAIIVNDPEYQAAKDRADFLAAVVEYLKGKLKYFENAFTSVKKIMGEGNYNMAGRAQRAMLDGILDEGKTAGQVQRPGFGKARY